MGTASWHTDKSRATKIPLEGGAFPPLSLFLPLLERGDMAALFVFFLE
jgi:hypothetical protein